MIKRVVFAKHPKSGLCKAAGREDKEKRGQDLLKSTHVASSGPHKISPGVLTWLLQDRPRPPREHSRGFIRAAQDLLRSARAPSSGPLRTSSGVLRGFIRAAQDLLRSITRFHQGRSRPPPEYYAVSSGPFKTSSGDPARLHSGPSTKTSSRKLT